MGNTQNQTEPLESDFDDGPAELFISSDAELNEPSERLAHELAADDAAYQNWQAELNESSTRADRLAAMLKRHSDPKHLAEVAKAEKIHDGIGDAEAKLSRRKVTLNNAPNTGDVSRVDAAEEAVKKHEAALQEAKQIRNFERGDFPSKQTDTAPPEPQAAPVVIAVGWSIKKPKRFQGYGYPLFKLLTAAHADGKPIPTARDVIDAWAAQKPPEVIEACGDGLKYYDAKGNAKAADIDAIRQAINRMIN